MNSFYLWTNIYCWCPVSQHFMMFIVYIESIFSPIQNEHSWITALIVKLSINKCLFVSSPGSHSLDILKALVHCFVILWSLASCSLWWCVFSLRSCRTRHWIEPYVSSYFLCVYVLHFQLVAERFLEAGIVSYISLYLWHFCLMGYRFLVVICHNS